MIPDLDIDLIPTPILRVGPDGFVEANDAARSLFDMGSPSTIESISGSFYGHDADVFRSALDEATNSPSKPVLVRWGTTPPVRYIDLTNLRLTSGDVIVSATDRTEQYRLDAATTTATGSALFLTDLNGVIRWVSPFSASVLASSQRALEGLDLLSIVHPDDLAALKRRIDDVVAHPGSEIRGAFRLRHPDVDDTWWPVLVTASYQPMRPAVGGLMVRMELSTEPGDDGADGSPDASADTDGYSPPRLQSIAEITPVGIIAASGGRLNLRNALARNLIGPLLDDADPYRWVGAAHQEHREELLKNLHDAATNGHRGLTRIAVDAPDGTTRWLRAETIPTASETGRYVGYVTTLLDVTTETKQTEELRAAQGQLWDLANHDTLTGLPNRLHFCDRLTNALAHQRRDARGVALLYGDLDRFKPVNDTFGHGVGDLVLAEVARRISEVTRETDTTSRYGGDEFLVLCEEYKDTAELHSIAERIIEAVSQPMNIDGREIEVGMSIGIAVADNLMTSEALLMKADQAMYEAKRTGRGRAVMASNSADQ